MQQQQQQLLPGPFELQVPRLVALVLTAPVTTSLLASLALAAALESPAAVLLRPFLGDVPQLLLR